MEKQRSIKVLSVIALIVAVLGLTVAFAALSSTLNITGTGSVKGNKPATGELPTWSIYFDDVVATPSSTNSSDITATYSETNIGDGPDGLLLDLGTIGLSLPGDTVTYTFNVVNAGSTAAELTDYLIASSPVCKDINDSTESDDAVNVCKNITFTFTYGDGSEIEKGATLAAATSVDSLTKKPLKLVVGYKEDADFIPTDDVTVTFDVDGQGNAIKMVYTQK